jgi:hypothetical protein
VNVYVDTEDGAYAVDLETEEVEQADAVVVDEVAVALPRVLAAGRTGSTIVALVDAVPPLMISYDAGATWRDSGRGLPPGRAVAVSQDDPDVIVYASRNRLHVSRDGGRFWTALGVELPEIRAVAL